MSKKYLRSCGNANMNTGSSACKVDWGHVKGAILVEHGQKLPENLTPESLAQLCHADRPQRIYPIAPFIEYAKNGGEAQVAANGYGPAQYNGMSPQTDTFTMPRYDEMIGTGLTRTASKEWDVYFWDSNNALIGYNDGTGILAGFPMSSVYPTATPFSTSSAKSALAVNFCHRDSEDMQKNFDYVMLDFNPINFAKGLTECQLVEISSGKYKIVEKMGGYDRTPEFGTVFASAVTEICTGPSAASYDATKAEITFTGGEGGITVKAPSVLFTSDIKWIEIVEVVPFE